MQDQCEVDALGYVKSLSLWTAATDHHVCVTCKQNKPDQEWLTQVGTYKCDVTTPSTFLAIARTHLRYLGAMQFKVLEDIPKVVKYLLDLA